MQPIFLLDENVDIRLRKFLNTHKCKAIICPKGLTDAEVFTLIKEKTMILVTSDKDFENIDIYKPTQTNGILSLRIHPTTITNIIPALEKLFTLQKPTELLGKITIVTQETVEVVIK